MSMIVDDVSSGNGGKRKTQAAVVHLFLYSARTFGLAIRIGDLDINEALSVVTCSCTVLSRGYMVVLHHLLTADNHGEQC